MQVSSASPARVKQARADLEALFESDATLAVSAKDIEDIQLAPVAALLEQAQQTLETLEDEQAEELQELLDQLGMPLAESETTISELQEELSDFITPPPIRLETL